MAIQPSPLHHNDDCRIPSQARLAVAYSVGSPRESDRTIDPHGMGLPLAERDDQLEPIGDDMVLKLSETSCIFRKVPLGRRKPRVVGRGMLAANDNVIRTQTFEATSAGDNPSLADVGPLLALTVISGGTFYVITTVLSGCFKSFPIFYP